MERANRGPKKGAGRKWAQKLKKLGERPPPQHIVERINRKDQDRAAKSQSEKPELGA